VRNSYCPYSRIPVMILRATTAPWVHRSLILLLTLLPAVAVHADRPRIHALTEVRIVPAPGQLIESGTVVLRDGLIEAVGANVTPPPDAEIIKGEANWTVYPAFIDAASRVGLEAEQPAGRGGPPGRGGEPRRLGAPHELPPVQPEIRVLGQVDFSNDSIKRHRRLGFAAAHVLPQRGVFRGESAVIVLREGAPAELVARDRATQVIALERQSFLARQYPSSRMGALALIRQVFLDAGRSAEWSARYAANPAGMPAPEFRASDEPLQPVLRGERPVLFVATAGLDSGRFRDIADEFSLAGLLLAQGLGDPAPALAAGRMPVLLPLELPDQLSVASEDDVADASLQQLQAQLNAPRLAAALERDGVRTAFVTQGMKDAGKFHANLAAMIKAGLAADRALAALTTTPAELLGLSAVMGSIAPGKQANLIVVEGELFIDKPVFKHLFVQGYHEVVKPEETDRGRGPRPGGRPTASVGGVL
jgi:hypothetical protein